MNSQNLLRFFRSIPVSYFISLIVFLVLIEIVSFLFNLPKYILPPPTLVIPYLLNKFSSVSKDVLTTLEEIFWGFLIGWVGAFILSVAACFSRLFRLFVRPLIVLSQTIPVIAIAPLLIYWFGFGLPSKIATAALLVIFPVFVGLTDGFLSVPQSLLDFMKASRVGGIKIFLLIQFPQAVPSMITATKIGITLSVIGAIIGEFVTAQYGIGLRIRQSSSQGDTELTFSMLYILGFIGVTLYSFLDMLELRLQKKYRKIM